MIELVRYGIGRKAEWDAFVDNSKNGTFLFKRDYMDYHADRFADHSLMFYCDNRLCAIMPANTDAENVLHSHQGLTYGGLILSDRNTADEVCRIFRTLKDYAHAQGIPYIIYKCVPHIYHRQPSEEDLYALFREFDARLTARGISSTINLAEPIPWIRLRKRCLRKALESGVTVEESSDYEAMWRIMTRNLKEKYGVAPVHSLAEITLLSNRFPNNIKLYLARRGDEILAGSVAYLTGRCVHVQYTHASPQGKESGAIDALYAHLTDKYASRPYFDFGISTEQGGRYLNPNLIFQKEGFGARGICYDVYTLAVGGNRP
ncbi:MAG: GNAT family N-acetyltransferase [Bacteroidaceae bacterium]|nr:GNAT family N-acetyltransferase [Bacteroidaceae bacterium]